MKSKRFSKLKVFGLRIFCLVAVHYVFFCAPSQTQMLAKFHQHKAQFEQIRLMLNQDRNVATIGYDWVTAKYGDHNGNQPEGVELRELPLNISQSRIDLYRARLKAIGFSRVDSSGNGAVQLEEFGGGFTDTSWGIGYVYSLKPLTPLVKSAYSQRPGRDQRHYSRIEGHWYRYQRR